MEVPAKFKSALVGLRYVLLSFLLVATSTFLLSCGSSSSVKITKGPDSITITVSSDTAHPGDEVEVIVTVADNNGDPLQGSTVELSISENNSNGIISPLEGVTDENGRITVIYTAGIDSDVNDVITATITIKADNETRVITASVTIAVDPTLIGSITVTSGTLT